MIFLPFMDGRLYSIVIFFPFKVTSAVPGGLGRALLSCCATLTETNASAKLKTPTARYLNRIGSFPKSGLKIYDSTCHKVF